MKNNEIDILLILEILKKRWWALVLCSVIGASLALSYSRFLVTPIYKSTALMYIDPKPSEQIYNLAFETTAITYVQQMMDTNVKILTTRDFMESVAKELTLKYGEEQYPSDDFNATTLAAMIDITAVEDTKLFNIQVKSTDQQKAYEIANVAKDMSIIRLQKIAEANAVTVADPPIKPTEASNNNSARNTVIGFFLGAVLCFGVLLLFEMFDVRIKSEDDFVNTYNIPLLGSVPNFERAYKTGKRTKPRSSSSGKEKKAKA